MVDVSDDMFEQLINESMDELPQEYIKNLKNVAITFADEPTTEQREKQKLSPNQTLFGLYEGIPLTKRGAGYNLVLPDRITIFKIPIVNASPDLRSLRENIKRTLWHEIAHHYGLDHNRINELEQKH